MNAHPTATFWHQRARLIAFVVNAAWAWQYFMPLFVVINLLFACFILVTRRSGSDLSTGYAWYLGAVVLGLVWTLYRVRKKQYRTEDAFVRIETALQLKSSLSSAAEGVASWPSPDKFSFQVLGLRPHVALLPVVYSALFILAGLLLPIQPASAAMATGDAVEPSAWTEVADWADILKQEDIIAAEAPKKLEERLAELRDRPKEDWYQQSSLEAGEAMRDETQLAMQQLAKRLSSTSTFLDEMAKQQAMPTLSESSAEKLDEAWLKQLNDLQMSEIALDPKTMSQLKQVSFSEMKSLSAEQIKEMSKRFKQSAGQCGGAAGLGEMDLEKMQLAVQAMGGEIRRGPGAAPLVMTADGTTLDTASREGVSNTDMRNAVLGETVGVSSRPGNDESSEAFQSGQQAGSVTGLGQGGDVVWEEFYTPNEQALLERYFK